MKMLINIEKNNKITLALKVKPNAKEDKIISAEEINEKYYLKISVKSPPEDGKANKAIIDLFSKILRIKKQDLEILRGASSQYKVLEIKNMDSEPLNALFSSYIK